MVSEQIQAFRRAVIEARRRGDISLRDAVRIIFWARFYYSDYVAIAFVLSDEPEQTSIDWDNFDPEKFRQLLQALAEFIAFIFDLFDE